MLSFTVSLYLAEFGVRYGLHSREERAAGAASFFTSWKNEYIQDLVPSGKIEDFKRLDDCAFSQTTTAHPYLNYVHHDQGVCGRNMLTRQGTISHHELPFYQSEESYDILVVGGSVASIFVEGGQSSPWLEEELNRRYISPNGKAFRVIGGALGGWGQPNQITMISQYGSAVHAVLNIDGYNETLSMAGKMSMEMPPAMAYFTVRPFSETMWIRRLVTVSHWIYKWALHSWGKHSFLLYDMFRSLIFLLNHQMNKDPDGPFEQYLFKYFRLPDEWSKEKRYEWNYRRYEIYSRQMKALAETQGLNYLHVLQPIRWIGKDLTPEEKSPPQLITAEQYQPLIDIFEKLKSEGFPVLDLTQVFALEKGRIYSDHIHYVVGDGWKSRGNELLSKSIAEAMAQYWNLRER
ncbi:MAG: hypothetical protein KDD35_06965 [Bdellovibrionales bacterium]|nr:hypothetical protein [Bdellovibrionales bacterium]